MGATIRDVARVAGVGLGTVSRVLNNSPLVSQATRQRVLDVIAELNYTPSQIARSFARGKTLTVATIVPFLTRPSVIERLRGIEVTLAASNYDLVVFNVENVARRDACLREVPRADRADGVIVISLAPRADEVAALRAAPAPVVLVDTAAADLYSVLVDDVAGGALATRHLVELGHRRIGFVGDPLDDPLNLHFVSSRRRFEGYRHALASAGLPFREDYHRHGPHGRYESRVQARELLQLPEPPTAIFAASDTQAMGVLEAARDLGLAVPDSLSVIGFDDIDVAEYLGLTTVRQPLFESGVRGAELVLELIAGGQPPRYHEYLPVELIARATTAPPPG
ncbi:MAG: LacI family DNA-binding transcriptional regulator [Chloroflexaceae bacterium]